MVFERAEKKRGRPKKDEARIYQYAIEADILQGIASGRERL
jgi:hypothetical protein